jgi:hypothetical protein
LTPATINDRFERLAGEDDWKWQAVQPSNQLLLLTLGDSGANDKKRGDAMKHASDRGVWCGGILAAAMIAVGISIAPASAQVRPGDFITPDNAYKVKDLLPPGAYARVVNGMTIKVEPTERLDWPRPYTEATEKYSGQVRLTADSRSLAGYIAGQPFPIVDVNDPLAAKKMIWNEVFRPISTDDYDLRWFDCDSVYWGRNAAFREITDIEIGHYAGYNEVGRTEVEPMPIDPDFKATGRYYMSLLYPVLAPASDRGTGSSSSAMPIRTRMMTVGAGMPVRAGSGV